MGFMNIKINTNIAGIGKIIKKVDKEYLNLKKKVNMLEILKMENVMDLAPFIVKMEMSIRENGKKVKKMVKVYIHFLKIKKDLKVNLAMIILLEENGM